MSNLLDGRYEEYLWMDIGFVSISFRRTHRKSIVSLIDPGYLRPNSIFFPPSIGGPWYALYFEILLKA